MNLDRSRRRGRNSDVFQVLDHVPPERLELEPAAELEAIRARAVECVRELVLMARLDGAPLPGAPTRFCWDSLRDCLGRKPEDMERRVFAHRWRNAMQLAYCDWAVR